MPCPAARTGLAARKRLIDRGGAVLFGVLVVLTLLFAAVPLLIGMVLSVDGRDFLGPFPPQDLSLRWYAEFFDNRSYLEGLVNSLTIAALSSAAALLIGVPAAVFIDRSHFAGRDLVEAFLLSPLIIPTVVTGFGVLMLTARLGIVDGLWRLLIGHTIIVTPYVIRATLAGLSGIPRSLEEAAMALGASEARAFVSITLPLARTGIAAGAIFAFVMSFDEVAASIFLSDAFTYTLPVALIAEMRANLNLTVAAASVMFMALTVALILVLDRVVGIDRMVGQGMYRTS